MEKIKLDCRNLACPQPVVETKRKLESFAEGTLVVLVDNETAKNNVLKLAASLGLEAAAKEDDGIYTITLVKTSDAVNRTQQADKKNLLITAETFGHGEEELGRILIKSFFYALAESNQLPQGIYFVNGGIKLACTGSPVLDSLIRLQKQGVKLYSCGLCLDYFQLKEKLQIGEITNMYAMVEQITAGTMIKI